MSARRRPALFLADVAGHLFHLIPHRKRFEVARRLGLALAKLYRHAPFYGRRPSLLDGAREECIRRLLRMMTRAGVPFVPELHVRGGELVPAGPALVLSAHFLLDIMMSRWLEEHGHPFTAVFGIERERMFVAGTRRPLDKLRTGPQVLVEIRGRLARGRKVLVNIEQPTLTPDPAWLPFDVDGVGRTYVSPAALRFAERARVPVLFAVVRMDDHDRMTLTFARPSAEDAETMLADYCDFLRAEAAQVRR